jgi:hypothetical protein
MDYFFIGPWVSGLLFCPNDHILGWGKMSQSGRFVTIQVKKGGRIVTATIRPPPGLGGCKFRVETKCHSGQSEP